MSSARSNRMFGGGRSDDWNTSRAQDVSPVQQTRSDGVAAVGALSNLEIDRLRLEMATQRREYERRQEDLQLQLSRADAELMQLRAQSSTVQGTLETVVAQRTKEGRDRTEVVRQAEELRAENSRLRKELSLALESKLSYLRTPAVSFDQYRALLQVAEQLITALDGEARSMNNGLVASASNGIAAARAWVDNQPTLQMDATPRAVPPLVGLQDQVTTHDTGISRSQSVMMPDSASVAALRYGPQDASLERGIQKTTFAPWDSDAVTAVGQASVAGLSTLGGASARESVSQVQASRRQAATAGGLQAPSSVALPSADGSIVREELVEGGKLFKLISDANPGKTWKFHNATSDLQFILDFTFGPQSVVSPLGDTQVERKVHRISLYPGETKDFIKGVVNGYRMAIKFGAPDDKFVPSTSKTDGDLAPVVDRVRQLGISNADELARACIAQGLTFVDLSFPPLSKSMARADEGAGAAVRWERANAVVPQGVVPELCVSGFDAGGPLRDCGSPWMSSAMSVLSVRRTEVLRCFARTSAQDRGAGLYRVTLCFGGWWQTTIVDSFIPCKDSKQANQLVPHGARCQSTRDVWASVMEKAIAKSLGSYAAISHGDALECLFDISGGVGERLDWRSRDVSSFNAFLKSWKHNVCVLMTASPITNAAGVQAPMTEDDGARGNALGFRAAQAYHVLAAVQCDDFRLCLISHAEGAASWNGPWSPKSETWIKHRAVKIACAEAESQVSVPLLGTMWLEWRDVAVNFAGAGILKLRPTWLDVRIANKFQGGKPQWILEVSVRKPTGLLVGIHQKDRRFLSPLDPDRAYSAFLITCVACNESGVWDVLTQSHGGTFWRGRDVHLDLSVTPRDRPYYILPRRYSEDRDRDAIVSMFVEVPDGVSVVLKQPTEEIMNAVRYSPVWKFDPTPCPALQPLPAIQIDGVESLSLSW